MDPLRPGIKQAVASRLGNPWALRVIIVLLWGFSTYLASSFRVGMQINSKCETHQIQEEEHETHRYYPTMGEIDKDLLCDYTPSW